MAVAAVGILIYRLATSSSKGDAGRPAEVGKDPLQEARELRDKGDLAGAMVKYEKIVAANPAHLEARAEVGILYHRLGYQERALPHLKAAREGGRGDAEFLMALGECQLSLGERREALAVLLEAEKKSPGARSALAVGDAYADLDRFDEAADAYRRLLESEPKFVVAALRLNRTLLLQGKVAEAERLTEGAVAGFTPEDREFAGAHLRAQVHREKGELEKALAVIEGVMKDGAKFWFDLARLKVQILLETAKYDGTVRFANEVMERSQTPDRVLIFADVGLLFVEALLLRGELAEARRASVATLERLKPYHRIGMYTPIREPTEALLLVVGRRNPEEFAALVETLPKRAHNDHYLLLAVLARAEGRTEDYRRHLQTAQERTLGRNHPYYLIEHLRKS